MPAPGPVGMWVVVSLLVSMAKHSTADTPSAKHVVLLIVDDLGFGDLGITGSAVKTPVLDDLAANGVRLLSYYVQRACSPTRAAIQTGRYNIRYRMQSGVLETGQRFGLALDETVLPQALRMAAPALTNPEVVKAHPGAAAQVNCTAMEGWNCGGGGIKGYAPVTGANATSDPAACCAHCAAVTQCRVWTIFSGQCYLKTANCKFSRVASAISGGSTPPPPPPYQDKCPPPPPVVPGSWATHAVGKWHLGFWQWAYTPTFRGYDSYLGYYTGGEDYYTHSTQGAFDMREDGCPMCGKNCSQPRFDLQGEYSTFIFTQQAEAVIAAHNDTQRLFLYLAYQAVHCPSEVPESYKTPYANLPEPRQTFAGMLSCLDEGVGNVTAALKQRGLWEDTLLIVSADNGAPTPACGGAQGGQNVWPFEPIGPLRGGKCSAWEGGLRGTAFISSPLLPPSARGRHVDALMHAVDIMPTIVEAVHGVDGVERLGDLLRAQGKPLDGMSLWQTIASSDPPEGPRTEALLEADPHALPWQKQYCGDQHGASPGTGYYALRRGNMKVILGDPAGGSGDGWYCTGAPCNYTGWMPSPSTLNATSVQLFDVVADPGEHNDLSTAQPEITKTLLAALLAYNATAEPSYVCGPSGSFDVNGVLTPFG